MHKIVTLFGNNLIRSLPIRTFLEIVLPIPSNWSKHFLKFYVYGQYLKNVIYTITVTINHSHISVLHWFTLHRPSESMSTQPWNWFTVLYDDHCLFAHFHYHLCRCRQLLSHIVLLCCLLISTFIHLSIPIFMEGYCDWAIAMSKMAFMLGKWLKLLIFK